MAKRDMPPFEPEMLPPASIRDYERSLDRMFIAERDTAARVVREALLTLYDASIVDSMIERMKPVLSDPRGERHRRERRFVRASQAII